ncbi:MAG: hypothetical protein U0132_12775 [Gemmatimonadaceae bacterium]
MRLALRTLVLAISLSMGTAACFKTKPGSAVETQQRTTVLVDNRNFLDFTIYLITGSQRIRLGTATGNSKTRLTIPAQFIFGATQLQFQADPIGGRTAPVSYPVTASPGDEVELIIPPNA